MNNGSIRQVALLWCAASLQRAWFDSLKINHHRINEVSVVAPEDNKLLIRRLFEDVINTGDVDRADDLVAPDFVEHNPAPGQGPGLEGFKQVVAMLRSAFPDLIITINELIAEGDLVSVRLTARQKYDAAMNAIGRNASQMIAGG